ncbi:origin recognition complex subunit 2 isoform X1 [Aphis gossypii]|uniref:origin recognition complex subunit 2 isoform X1 n=2 Tax=Aphis gossypii TaxID=80765 RepID=UPI00100F7424|nr:origin recognition complex subunit 2 isoform X1 [Aphis gossypii]XP_027845327.1 origin recognition complex subunit 2 isoform X1 [Aphis gossypii]XP_027845328.1 origin recognition complex subunit 2 isoform X1 [Aphis gossypii]XP_050057575.1 origin recognition complex subunit 2 isoform X1 [Aphis gossypii]XP_050057576.1 origin recognition complex subunit 2 isoform X1 [Aphis gossypii]
MELPSIDKIEIQVEFIDDQAVKHLITDDAKNHSTRKNKSSDATSHNTGVLIKCNKTNRILDETYDEESDENEPNVTLKPKALFEDGDVPGERMFGFHSKQNKRHTTNQKNTISQHSENHQYHNKDEQKVCNIRPQAYSDDENQIKSKKCTRSKTSSAISKIKNEVSNIDSPRVTDGAFDHETPKKLKKIHTSNISEQVSSKTPRTIRKRIAKGIAHQKFEQLNELNDSDYSISDESDSDSSIHTNLKTVQPEETQISLRRSIRKKDVPFIYKSDEYFLSKSAKSVKKSKTSDNTLKLLKNPVLDKEQVDQLSGNSYTKHDIKIKTLYKNIMSNFPYWLSLLREGFNLLLYGLGSKRQIINDFRTSVLAEESVLMINGFFPGLTMKEILESITIGLLDLDSCPGSAELAIQQIEEKLKLKTSEHIYILINNLDGVELQNYKAQHILSRISSLKKVHLIASMDRVNSALMFDNTKLGDYNFLWMDCTNFLPYTVETNFIQSLMVKNIGTQHSFSGLNNVFKSLTSNAKSILLLLIKDRIENKNDKKYGGVPFSTLYRWCRQRFLASTDLALRSQLTEFVDHELVKWKRDVDVLYVPVDIDVLAQFYKQNEEDDE